MSYSDSDDAPPVRKPSTSKLRGRMSLAYEFVTPELTIQEATPELQQGPFDSDDLYADPSPPTPSPEAGPSGYTPEQTSDVSQQARTPSPHEPKPRPTTPDRPTSPFSETTPRQRIDRRSSIPVRNIPIRSPTIPTIVDVNCTNCKSVHKINVSEADRVTILDCKSNPPPTPPQPSILDIYNLPGYLQKSSSGKILVKTETELLSYVRKIFSPMKGFNGYFPYNRHYSLDRDDDLPENASASSTPDDKRASHYLGHSKYLGTMFDSQTNTSAPNTEASTKASPSPVIAPTRATSSPGPQTTDESGPPPPVNRDSKPVSRETSRQRSVSPLALVRTVTPSRLDQRQQSPRHASASRQASPRNLHPIGIFSDSEVDLSESFDLHSDKEVAVEQYMPTSALRSPSPYNTRTVMPAEIYTAAAEVSKELEAEQKTSGLQSSRYATSSQSPHSRGRKQDRH